MRRVVHSLRERDRVFYIYLLLAIAETSVLLWFSFAPSVDFVRTGFMRLGDLEHLIAYAVYGFLLAKVLGYFARGWKVVLFSLILGTFVGGFSEAVQHFLPYRVGDVADFFIDSAGTAAGALISSKFKISLNKLKTRVMT